MTDQKLEDPALPRKDQCMVGFWGFGRLWNWGDHASYSTYDDASGNVRFC